MKSLAVWLAVPALSLGACATVPPTPEQVAACQEMERDMGVGVRHDHAEMKQQGWSRLYWNTKENNYRARGLYDKYTPHSGFLRYVVNNPDAAG